MSTFLLMKEIELRLIHKNDAPFLKELMNAPNWIKYIGDRHIYSTKAAENYIQSKMSPILNEKGFINHIIIDIEKNQEVGTCSLHLREGMPGMDIGYALLPEFEGMGYASAAAVLMIKMAFEVYHQEKVYAITTDENINSCQLLLKLGFKKMSKITLNQGTESLRLFCLSQVHSSIYD